MDAPPVASLYPTDPLSEVRDLFSLDPYLIDVSPEIIAERLCCEPWVAGAALEALVVDGEVAG